MAVTRPYSTQKETDFIPCQVWNKQAIVLQKYCQKGSQIAITGILQSFKDKDNKIQWMVRVSNYEFLHTNNDLKKDILLSEKPQEIIVDEKINYSSEDTKDLMGDNDAILWD